MSNSKTNARQAVVQALYQWQMNAQTQSLNLIEQQFADEGRLKEVQKNYFKELLHGIPEKLDEIDEAMKAFVDRPVDAVDPVERAILRLGVYELLFKPEMPYRVVLNESINLAKEFGADGSHRYVNGVLDKVAQEKRVVEVKSKAQDSRQKAQN
jgi:transcription antitermination protein NusB